MYWAVHSPTPASDRSWAMASSRLLRGTEDQRVGDDGRGQRRQRHQPGLRHSKRGQIRRASLPRRRKHVGQPQIEGGGIGDLLAVGRNQFAGEPRRRGHRDLLAKNGAHSEFKSVPRAGNPQARPSSDKRRQHRVLAEMRADRQRIGGQIEDTANARDHRRQAPEIWQANGCLEDVALAGSTTNDAALVADRDRAGISAARDHLDAWDGARSKERQDGIPVVGRPVAQPDRDRARRADRLSATPLRRSALGRSPNSC